MSQHRWHPIPIVLVSAAALAVWTVAIVERSVLGWWQLLLYAGGIAALAAVFWFRRQLSQTEIELESLRKRLADEEFRLANERAQVEELRRAVEQELQQQAARLDKRELALADRLVAYREWMEFPEPVNLIESSAPSPANEKQLADLARKDRQLNELLKNETKILYDNILANKYAIDGVVQIPVIRDDALALVHKVAAIYRPGIEQPLLGASLARITRGASRACLQVLVVLDELPLGVKDASLATLYGYVRNAVKAWQLYKTSEPYWPYVNAAWYLGRFAMGANPLTLGAWWFVGSLSQRGAKAVATHLVNRQALALLASLVRILGYEVAGIYGDDFRHRDANWIYAAELSELLASFPLSRDSLAHALREIGALDLRSEYDRIFLYRCLAGHKSARPQQYQPDQFLSMSERQAIALRLEKSLATFIHGKSADRVTSWKRGVEERLGVKLATSLAPTSLSVRAQLDDGIRSLASFLIAAKQLEPGELRQYLATTQLLAELPEADREPLLTQLQQDPPFFFEHPDLDPDSDLVGKYLADLALLHARTSPRDELTEETLLDVAVYLRRERKQMQAILAKQYAALLADRLASDAPVRKFDGPIARAALDLLEPGEQARFLYPGVTLAADNGHPAGSDSPSLWLLGAGDRLIAFAIAPQPRVVWRGTPAATAEQCRNLVVSHCRLTGGATIDNGQPAELRIPTGLLSSYATYFRPLLAMLKT